MKKLIIILLLTALYGCKKTIVIKGIIKNYNDSIVTCYWGFNDTCSIKDGQFRFTYSIIDSQYVTINAGKSINLFVLEGDSVYLEIDAATGEYTISGTNEANNQFIQDEEIAFDSINKSINKQNLFDVSYSAFAKSFDSLCNLIPKPSEKLPLKMQQFEAERKNYFRATVYYRYPFNHALNTRTKYSQPSDFREKTPVLNFKDSTLLELSEYRNFLSVYLDVMAKLKMETGSKYKDNIFTNEEMDIALEEFSNADIKYLSLQNIMFSHLQDFGVFHADSLMNRLMNNVSDSFFIYMVQSEYDKHKQMYQGQLIVPYRKTKETELSAHIYLPESKEVHPAVCLFFGGGWYIGTVEELIEVAKAFAEKGYVAILFDYRTKGRFNTTPADAVEDAKYAISWTRQNAKKWNIDTKQIISFGHSAGGHLAASTALLKGFESPLRRIFQNSQPNAVALSPSCINPTVDNWFCYCLGSDKGIEKLSPVHNIRKGIPPFIVFLGTKDPFIPTWTALEFRDKMIQNKNTCELHLIKDLKHRDFLNSRTVDTIDIFLNKYLFKERR